SMSAGAVKFNYSKGNYVGFCEFMDRNWSEVFQSCGDIDSSWNEFKTVLADGMTKFIPKCKNNSWKKKDCWQRPISRNLKNLINKKHRLWTRYQETKQKEAEREYKRVRNSVRNETRKLTRKEQLIVAQSCKTNPKKFWKHIRSKTKTRSLVGDLKVIQPNGSVSVVSEDIDKCKAFSEYLSNIYTSEPPGDFETLELRFPLLSMPELIIDESDIKNRLAKLKTDKSPGSDSIHPRVLCELSEQICGALKYMFELSVNTGVLPSDWKNSIVSVLHKKGSKADLSNYRPISLTSIICKLLESIIRDHIMNYFTCNKFFSSRQFGFIKNRSTTIQMMKVMDLWTAQLERGGQIDVIYTDFEKAFDKVPHKRLISKLRSYCVDERLISWIEGFICYRSSQVRINGKCSDWKTVSSGIPQGSVLGPLLFVIYINDLPLSCNSKGELFLFADDAKLFNHISCIEDSVQLLEGCQLLQDWCEKWLMKLNINKCKVLSIGHKPSKDFKYGFSTVDSGFTELEHVNVIKDLGVTVDSDLSFVTHINEKVNKAFQMIGLINRNFINIDRVTFLLLYKSMIRSHLEYAHAVWSPYKSFIIENLEKVQKRATKLVFCCKKLSYQQRLEYLQLPTLKFRRLRGDMIETYKILNRKYDPDITPKLQLSRNAITRGNSLKLDVERTRYDLRKYSFSPRVVNLWNSLPDSIILSDNVNCFKNSLDKHWNN
ncbi:MAG: RNA-directed DNA polymerase, partial [Nitrososphaerales archaeon]